ncbi:MAG: DUF1800 family protein [Paracoccaceae bacterium]
MRRNARREADAVSNATLAAIRLEPACRRSSRRQTAPIPCWRVLPAPTPPGSASRSSGLQLWPLMAEYGAARRESVAESSGATPRLKAAVAAIHAAVYDGMRARLSRGALAEDGFRERLTWFWADHFTVRATNIRFLPGPATYVEEAIRPHLGGPFSKMLRAAAIHPVMLSYLDQDSSIGPMSQVGQRDDGGLNENLARGSWNCTRWAWRAFHPGGRHPVRGAPHRAHFLRQRGLPVPAALGRARGGTRAGHPLRRQAPGPA